ncbi:MAG: energy transducer TonB, partial [bacterium]
EEIEREKKIFGETGSSKPQIPSPGFVPFEKAPQITKRAQPVYPEIAIQARIEGTVWLKCLITVNGDVGDLVIAKAAHPILNMAALAAVSQFKFTPAMQANSPVPVWVSLPIDFKLDDVYSSRISSTNKIEFYDRNFLLQEFDGEFILSEDGCKISTATEIEYLSKAHFALLYDHPELIKFSYYFKEICYCIDPSTGEGVWITLGNQFRRE